MNNDGDSTSEMMRITTNRSLSRVKLLRAAATRLVRDQPPSLFGGLGPMCAHAGTGCSALMSATICRPDLVGVKLKLFSSGPQLKSTCLLGCVSALKVGMGNGSRRDLHFNVFQKGTRVSFRPSSAGCCPWQRPLSLLRSSSRQRTAPPGGIRPGARRQGPARHP